MTRLARCVACTVLLVASLGLGCTHNCENKRMWLSPHAEMETLGQTSDEHYHSVRMSREHDQKGLAEDLDLWFQTDRPTRLTRWHDK